MATACTFSRCRVWYGLNNSFWRNPVHLWQKIKSHNQSNYTHFPPSSSITICRNQFSYGSVSAWREIWLFRVIFSQKVQCWSTLVNICWIFCNLLGGPRQPQASKWWWRSLGAAKPDEAIGVGVEVGDDDENHHHRHYHHHHHQHHHWPVNGCHGLATIIVKNPTNVDRTSNCSILGSKRATEVFFKKRKFINILWARWWTLHFRSSFEGIITWGHFPNLKNCKIMLKSLRPKRSLL